MSSKWWFVAAASGVLALGVAACGSDDNGDGSSTSVSGTIRIDGSSTVGPLTSAVAEQFQQENPDVKVTVGTKPDGAKGLVLDYVPETARIKPKAEVVAPVKKASKAAKPKEMETVGAEPESHAKPKKASKAAATEASATATAAEPPRKGSTVPKVPRKK